MLAINSSSTPFDAAVGLPDERLDQYAFLSRLPAGLRAEVWLALPAGSVSLSQLVAIKIFFPHASKSARAALALELAFAQRLAHPNVVQTQRVVLDADRPFIVKEHLEGMTLGALLRRARVSRARVAPAAASRLLLGIVRAVRHAEERAASPSARAMAAQAIAVEDVFVTFDGAVKLLGFKAPTTGAQRRPLGAPARLGSSGPAAIDALLAAHLTPELAGVLASGTGSDRRDLPGLARVERALERWQAQILGSDGRAELAALVDGMFPAARLDQRTKIEASLAAWTNAAYCDRAFTADDSPPASGPRRRLR